MMRSPRRRTMRTDSDSTSAWRAARSSGSSATSRPSAFDTIFWVTTRQSPSASGVPCARAASAISSASSSPGRISPMPSIGRCVSEPGTVAVRRRRRACARASAAATSGLRIIVSATTAWTPAASTAATRCASTASITSVPQNSAYARATPTHDTSMPSGAISRSAGPFTGAPPTIGLTATTRSRRATQRVADAGDREDRADRDHRVRRAHEHRLGGPERVEHARRGPGVVGAVEAHAASPRVRALPHEPLLHRELGPVARRRVRTVMRVRTRSSVIGSRRTSSPQAAAISAVTSESGAPGAEPLGAEEVGGEVLVAEAEPRVGVVALQARRGWRRSRPRGPSPARGSTRRRACR